MGLWIRVMPLVLMLPSFASSQKPGEKEDDLHFGARIGDHPSILRLGERGESSDIPFLRNLLKEGDRSHGSASEAAQMALARLGVEAFVDEILDELKIDDPAVQMRVTQKLGYVGGKRSVKALAGLLGHDKISRKKLSRPKDSKARPRTHLFEPLSFSAVRALWKIVPNPPVPPRADPTAEDVKKWKEWWQKHKSGYE